MGKRKALPPYTLPDQFVVTLPFGYRIRVKQYKQKIHGGWVDFDAHRWGEIWIKSGDSYDEQLDDLRHEMEHALTDWGGKVRKLENDYREFKKEEGDDR